jgi:hypothetical protein
MLKRLLLVLAAVAAMAGCGGSDDNDGPRLVWVIWVQTPVGGDPPILSNAEGVLLYILRLRIPIYSTSCATTPIPDSFNSFGIYRYQVSESDATQLLASGIFMAREPYEAGKVISENPVCQWR